MISKAQATVARYVGIMLFLGGAGCHHQHQLNLPDRQDMYLTRPSGYGEILPKATSIEDQYIPSKDGQSPNSPAAYHVTPSLSYEDRTLDENLASSLEHADYYRAVKRAGWQRWFQAEGPYTVLAIPNEALESYVKGWPGSWTAKENHARLVHLVGQTIIVGKWDIPKIRRQARRNGGSVTVTTFNGSHLTMRPLPSSGEIAVHSDKGEAHLVGGGYPQSNGMLYMMDSILPD